MAWSGSREQFLHCGLRKFRHSKSSVYRWYTQFDRGRFVSDTWDNGSRLGRVMVECTLFMTHCLRLNLQFLTISLVRTCRISSFCTVAWQLARLLLTRRIARSLGDSGASCLYYFWFIAVRKIAFSIVGIFVSQSHSLDAINVISVSNFCVLQALINVTILLLRHSWNKNFVNDISTSDLRLSSGLISSFWLPVSNRALVSDMPLLSIYVAALADPCCLRDESASLVHFSSLSLWYCPCLSRGSHYRRDLWMSVVALLRWRCISQSAVVMAKDGQTHYDVLGLTPSATKAQIKDAFVRLSKQVFQHQFYTTQPICGHCRLQINLC